MGIDMEKTAEDMGIDVEDIKELFGLYVETTSQDLAGLKEGIEKKDALQIHERAHSIKGASGNLGLVDFYETARDIDERSLEKNLDGLEDIVENFSNMFDAFTEEFESF